MMRVSILPVFQLKAVLHEVQNIWSHPEILKMPVAQLGQGRVSFAINLAVSTSSSLHTCGSLTFCTMGKTVKHSEQVGCLQSPQCQWVSKNPLHSSRGQARINVLEAGVYFPYSL